APEERFQNMGELWDALRSSLAMEPSRAFSAGSADSTRSSNPQVTHLAGPNAPISITGPPLPVAVPGMPPPQTIITGPTPRGPGIHQTMPAAQPAKGNGGIIALVAICAVAFLGVVGTGVYLSKKSKGGPATSASSSAAAVTSA